MIEIHVDKNKVIEIINKLDKHSAIVIHRGSTKNPKKEYDVTIDNELEKSLNLTKDDYERGHSDEIELL